MGTYVLEGDVLVGDVLDGAGSAGDGLDADTVVRVNDLRVKDLHGVDNVVVTAADGADGETVAAGAGTASEDDVLAYVRYCSVLKCVGELTSPELMARQSSWFLMLALLMVM